MALLVEKVLESFDQAQARFRSQERILLGCECPLWVESRR